MPGVSEALDIQFLGPWEEFDSEKEEKAPFVSTRGKQLTNTSWNILCVGSISMHKTKCFADLIRLGASGKIKSTLESFLGFFCSQNSLDGKKMRVSPLLLSDPAAGEGDGWQMAAMPS